MTTQAFTGRIGILGAGALGALYGARIARAGYDVHFLMRSDFDAVRERGLEIRSHQGDFTLRPPVYRTPEDMGPCDLLIVGLKTTDTSALADMLPHTVHRETIVLTLQNGLGNEEQIVRMLEDLHPDAPAASRVVGGVAFLGSNRIAPGVIHHTDYGHVRLAEFDGASRDRTQVLAKLFTDAEFGCEIAESLVRIRWEKLVWNIPFNGLGVAAESADTGVLLGSPDLAESVRALMSEVLAAARADNVGIPESHADHLMDITRRMQPYRSSMQIDFECGRPLEVEALLGEPLRRAQRAGIDVPLMRLLYAIVARRDAMNRQSG